MLECYLSAQCLARAEIKSFRYIHWMWHAPPGVQHVVFDHWYVGDFTIAFFSCPPSRPRPPGHPVTRPPGHPATRPPGHPGHPATRPPGHPPTRPPPTATRPHGHRATRPPGHGPRSRPTTRHPASQDKHHVVCLVQLKQLLLWRRVDSTRRCENVLIAWQCAEKLHHR